MTRLYNTFHDLSRGFCGAYLVAEIKIFQHHTTTRTPLDKLTLRVYDIVKFSNKGRTSMIFQYGKTEIDYLKKRDKTLGRAIDAIGFIERSANYETSNADLFSALIKAVVGQQISTKAAATVWQRMEDGLGKVAPETILAISEGDLQSFGISFRKAGYIRGAAESVASGQLDILALHEKSDDQVVKELSSLNGIGTWTAEMLMLFAMQRPDILSYGDLAIHRGMQKLYRRKKITPEMFEGYRQRYTPHSSVASLYLWAIAGGAYI